MKVGEGVLTWEGACMTQCPRGGGSAHSRESNYSGNTAFRPRETPSSSFPPPPPSPLPLPSLSKCKYKCKCTCKSRMGWVQHNFIKDIKAKTHLSLASIGSKRENCTTDS